MPYIQLDGGVVVGVYPNPQPGFAEEWREDDDADVLAYLAPAPAEPHLNGGGLARFSGTLPAVLHEAIRMAAVTRISKGRYRVTHEEAMPSDQYSATRRAPPIMWKCVSPIWRGQFKTRPRSPFKPKE
jgi:hypothetical protein